MASKQVELKQVELKQVELEQVELEQVEVEQVSPEQEPQALTEAEEFVVQLRVGFPPLKLKSFAPQAVTRK